MTDIEKEKLNEQLRVERFYLQIFESLLEDTNKRRKKILKVISEIMKKIRAISKLIDSEQEKAG